MPSGVYKRTEYHRNLQKGKKVSNETREKLRVSHLGNKQTEKTKEKLRVKMQKRIKDGLHNWYIDGRTADKEYINWQKNKRNRVVKRLKEQGTIHTYGEWELLKKQYGYICPCCKKPEPDIKLTEDHIIPLSKGGSDYIENIQPLCLHCNMVKHTNTIKYDYDSNIDS